jgi:hypothetical protein
LIANCIKDSHVFVAKTFTQGRTVHFAIVKGPVATPNDYKKKLRSNLRTAAMLEIISIQLARYDTFL